jgi:hypothetical protein
MKTSEFAEMAAAKAEDPQAKRFDVLWGKVVMGDQDNTWRDIDYCATCEEDFEPDGDVYYDEVNNLVFCKNCVPDA